LFYEPDLRMKAMLLQKPEKVKCSREDQRSYAILSFEDDRLSRLRQPMTLSKREKQAVEKLRWQSVRKNGIWWS